MTHRAGRQPVMPLQSCSIQDIREMLARFVHWLEKAGYWSYDPYDVWGTHYGLRARKLYYANNPLGMALTAPVILMEIVCPSLRKLLIKKKRYATADAQLVLGFLNMHDALANGSESDWLIRAKRLAEELLTYSVPGFRGFCWGYPFHWQHCQAFTPKDTPVITATPYCFEAFLRLADITGEARYLGIAQSIVAFVDGDLNDTPCGEDATAGSYTPYDSGKVINASAYRAFVLFEAAHRFGVGAYADRAQKNLRFILQHQRSDGSWLYAIDNPAEAFIDHFHTCFVLKNLYKIYSLTKDSAVVNAIERGYAYYRRELFNGNGLPKSFAIESRVQISHLEMYNVAEAINLGTLLCGYLPDALLVAHHLAALLKSRFQLPDGHFITRTYIGGINHKLPFLRWPQAQLFHALTNLLLADVVDTTATASQTTSKDRKG